GEAALAGTTHHTQLLVRELAGARAHDEVRQPAPAPRFGDNAGGCTGYPPLEDVVLAGIHAESHGVVAATAGESIERVPQARLELAAAPDVSRVSVAGHPAGDRLDLGPQGACRLRQVE